MTAGMTIPQEMECGTAEMLAAESAKMRLTPHDHGMTPDDYVLFL
jgi:hypothetical protein